MSAPGPPPIIDADGHVVEPTETWSAIPNDLRGYVPTPVVEEDAFYFRSGDAESFRMQARPESLASPRGPGERSGAGNPAVGAADPKARLSDMDLDHIAQAVVFPTYGLMVQAVPDRNAQLALCRAINDWVADYCRGEPSRLFGMGVLPQTGPEDALVEARRCIEHLDLRGVWRRPERIDGTPALHDASYEPLWSYLAEADRAFALHPGLNGLVPATELRARFEDDYSTMHAVHFPMEQIMGLTDLIGFGVLDRHPTLRVAFLECGATWALAQLHRLDEHLELFGLPHTPKEKPSEQFRRQGFVSVEEVEPGLEATLEAYPDSIVFASDYPHGDGVFPGSTTELLETDRLDPAQRDAVFFGNARRLYRL
ncbi:MAG: amidohydrolase [bacterium]|nr:amidohydrolase [bacterium]